jgi:hypothetical protein
MDSRDSTMSRTQRLIHHWLCLLVVSMVFEGIARKAAPHSAGILIFFTKDLITFILLLLCVLGDVNTEAKRLLGVMGILVFLLGPCILATISHDPVLAVFGVKQYALFPTVAVAMCAAYLPNHRYQLFSLFRLIAFSVVVTTLVAVAQNRLPSSNWLNLSVTGGDLSGFSADGYLRVSSTFPFVSQYCTYLNALCYCLPVYFYFSKFFGNRAATIQMMVLIGLSIVGTFVTGSRGSVIGSAAILTVGGALAAFRGGSKAIMSIIITAVLGIMLFGLLQSQFPQFFAAYETRMGGPDAAMKHKKLEDRIISDLLDWSNGSVEAPPSFLGYGLGVMSNGSDKLSSYAARWRSSGFWTESDRATTFFEGGWYLIFVWYGFRLWVIFQSLGVVLRLHYLEFRMMASFAWGYVAVIGVMGTLAIQPPLAIWWWLAVGLVICLGCFDRAARIEAAKS